MCSVRVNCNSDKDQLELNWGKTEFITVVQTFITVLDRTGPLAAQLWLRLDISSSFNQKKLMCWLFCNYNTIFFGLEVSEKREKIKFSRAQDLQTAGFVWPIALTNRLIQPKYIKVRITVTKVENPILEADNSQNMAFLLKRLFKTIRRMVIKTNQCLIYQLAESFLTYRAPKD